MSPAFETSTSYHDTSTSTGHRDAAAVPPTALEGMPRQSHFATYVWHLRRGDAVSQRAALVERAARRKLGQWILSYLAMAWLLLQLLDVVADIWSLPPVVGQACSLALGLGVYPTAVLAWYHGERGRQRVCPTEVALLGLFLLASLALWKVWGSAY